MGPIAPSDPLLIDKSDVGFVDERRRLEGMAGRLATHVTKGQLLQVFVDNRGKALERVAASVTPSDQQLRDSRRIALRITHGSEDKRSQKMSRELLRSSLLP